MTMEEPRTKYDASSDAGANSGANAGANADSIADSIADADACDGHDMNVNATTQEEEQETVSQDDTQEYVGQKKKRQRSLSTNGSNDGIINSISAAKHPPKFAIKQRVLARDTDTPLLYDAIVRKQIYAPKSKKYHIGRVQLNTEDTPDYEQLDDLFSSEVTHTWHYFVHYQGWNVKWDRWIQEDSLFEDTENTKILAKRLKEESKCLKKRKSDKIVLEVMQRMLKLEEEFRRNESGDGNKKVESARETKHDQKGITEESSTNDRSNDPPDKKQKKNEKEIDESRNTTKKKRATSKFIQKEIELRKRDLCSKKPSNAVNIPFILKKLLTDEWEVISQCGMVHNLPATVSVMDALNAYHDSKIKMLRNDVAASNNDSTIEEKKDDNLDRNPTSSFLERNVNTISNIGTGNGNGIGTNLVVGNCVNGSEASDVDETTLLTAENAAEQEWKDMIVGLAMYFDHALPKKLLYRHELPQCIVLEGKHPDKRYCELYPCEHLIRLCLKLPELVDSAEDMTEEEKSKIFFKLGDLVRFLQKHQDTFLLQRYRKPNIKESQKAERLESRLGIMTKKSSELIDEDENHNESEESEHEETKRKKRKDTGQRKKRKLTS